MDVRPSPLAFGSFLDLTGIRPPATPLLGVLNAIWSMPCLVDSKDGQFGIPSCSDQLQTLRDLF
jgi:hypothetical protein